ncbi:hypothetical protein MCP1_240014 [Candidatus Terasakiella magnetica]|nr:hypothetical protein MCP1_240014 [Candidatus Terasakiella magnetica]
MKTGQARDIFSANLASLSGPSAFLAQHLRGLQPSARIVVDASGAENLDLGGGALLYPQGAAETVARQVEHYLTEPVRFCVSMDAVGADDNGINALLGTLRQRMAPLPKAAEQGAFGGFLVVFGIGLGRHIEQLAERLAFKTLIVVETLDELIYHSFHVTDWHRLQQNLARDGRDIRFVRGEGLYDQIIAILRGPHFPFLDGSYFYWHYQNPEFSAVSRKILIDCPDLSMAGWLEDQLVMLRNTAANFSRPGFFLKTGLKAPPRTMPAMVVGAGPSLDAAIDDIRRCRQDVVLITGSSALKVMLANGIRPDIHCEVENSFGLGDVALDLDRKYGLSDIALFASCTVNPRIAPRFRTAAYLFRSTLCSSYFYGSGVEHTPLADPTSGNLALYCALSLGFREIYLAGLDFGARDPDQHHSRHSVYYTYESEAEMATYTPYDFDQEMPGNFGGTVRTGWVLKWGHENVVRAIATLGQGVRVMNCSDGALIPGAHPLLPESIDLAPSHGRQAHEVRQAFEALTPVTEDRSDRRGLAAMHRVLRHYMEVCLAVIEDFVPRPDDPPQAELIRLADPVIGHLTALKAHNLTAYLIVAEYTQTAFLAACHYASRLDPADAGTGVAMLRQSLGEGFERMLRVIDTEFAGFSGMGGRSDG